MKILIAYPHGLGDCILLTPALRELKRQGFFVGVAMLERFESAKLFNGCPYVDELFYTKDAWNDFGSLDEGKVMVDNYCKELASKHCYDDYKFVWHPKNKNKIISSAEILKVELSDFYTEVFITNEDIEEAMRYFTELPYGFIHTNTGVSSKDLPKGYGESWLRKNKGLDKFIEVGKDFKYNEISIGAQFVLMSGASSICVPDSVFYHAACAMRRKVDFAYFARGIGVYEAVKPLHDVDENVSFKLEDIYSKNQVYHYRIFEYLCYLCYLCHTCFIHGF